MNAGKTGRELASTLEHNALLSDYFKPKHPADLLDVNSNKNELQPVHIWC